jgi:hypothetical protein
MAYVRATALHLKSGDFKQAPRHAKLYASILVQQNLSFTSFASLRAGRQAAASNAPEGAVEEQRTAADSLQCR